MSRSCFRRRNDCRMNHKTALRIALAALICGAGALVLFRPEAMSPESPVPAAVEPSTFALVELNNKDKPMSREFEQPDFASRIEELLQTEPANRSEEWEAELTQWLRNWIALDAITAMEFARALEAAELRADVLRRMWRLWGEQDSVAALSWAEQIEFREERELAVAHVYRDLAERDPQSAAITAAARNHDDRDGLLTELTLAWATKDLPAARDWVAQQPAGDRRDQLMARVVFVESQHDPANAASRVVQQMSPSVAQEEAAISVLHQWALRDFTAGTAWVELFPAGTLRDRAQSELAGIALYQSP
jgi:hypothetical protein